MRILLQRSKEWTKKNNNNPRINKWTWLKNSPSIDYLRRNVNTECFSINIHDSVRRLVFCSFSVCIQSGDLLGDGYIYLLYFMRQSGCADYSAPFYFSGSLFTRSMNDILRTLGAIKTAMKFDVVCTKWLTKIGAVFVLVHEIELHAVKTWEKWPFSYMDCANIKWLAKITYN